MICQAAEIFRLGPKPPQRTFEELIHIKRPSLRHLQVFQTIASSALYGRISLKGSNLCGQAARWRQLRPKIIALDHRVVGDSEALLPSNSIRPGTMTQARSAILIAWLKFCSAIRTVRPRRSFSSLILAIRRLRPDEPLPETGLSWSHRLIAPDVDVAGALAHVAVGPSLHAQQGVHRHVEGFLDPERHFRERAALPLTRSESVARRMPRISLAPRSSGNTERDRLRRAHRVLPGAGVARSPGSQRRASPPARSHRPPAC